MDNFLGEIRLFPYNRIPKGWVECRGQQLAVNQNQALFALLGNTYGGNTNVFNLPNLNYSVIMGADPGGGMPGGTTGGKSAVALRVTEIPMHTHGFKCSPQNADITQPRPQALPAVASGPNENIYGTVGPNEQAQGRSVSGTGGSQAHNNIQPSLGMVYCIATLGTFPTRP